MKCGLSFLDRNGELAEDNRGGQAVLGGGRLPGGQEEIGGGAGEGVGEGAGEGAGEREGEENEK